VDKRATGRTQKQFTMTSGGDTMDKKLAERILKDGKIDKVEMKVIAGYVGESGKLTKEEKLLLRDIFTRINSGELKLES